MKLQRYFLIIIFIASSFVALSQGIPLGGYFDVLVQSPIDSRLVKDDNAGRDAIVPSVRYQGLIVFVESTGKNYQLIGGITNSDWVEIGGGASSLIPGLGIYFGQDTINAYIDSATWNANKLVGYNISTSVPPVYNNYVLGWDSANAVWKPSPIISGGYIPPTYSASTGLSLTGNTFSAQTTTALWNANQLQGYDISAAAPTDGQTLTWDNTNSLWKVSDVQGSLIANTGISISNDTISALNNTSIWNAGRLQGYTISSSVVPVYDKQILSWDSTNAVWQPAYLTTGGYVPTTYTASTGLILAGNTFSAQTTQSLWNANQLQGFGLSSSTPTAGQILQWNNTSGNWEPTTASFGSSLIEGTGITITNDTINADAGTSIWNAAQLVGYDISTSVPPVYHNYVLSWDSNAAAWKPAPITMGGYIPTTYTAGTGLLLTGNIFSAQNSLPLWNANLLQGNLVSTSSLNDGDVLTWDSAISTWKGLANSPGGGSGSTYFAGTGINITLSDTINAESGSALWNANKLQNYNVSSNVVPNFHNYVLGWDSINSEWRPAPLTTGVYIPNTYTAGTGLQLSGNTFSAQNTLPLWNSNQLQNNDVSVTSPTVDGQVLTWNNTSSLWEPALPFGYTAGTGLTLSGQNFDAQTTQALWNANQLQGKDLSMTGLMDGYVLGWDSTNNVWKGEPTSGFSGHWTLSGTNVYRNSGNVGIGTDSPSGVFEVGSPSSPSNYSTITYTIANGGWQNNNDMSLNTASNYTGTINKTFDIEILATSVNPIIPDSFRWRVNSGTWSIGFACTTSWYSLGEGVQINWASVKGHYEGFGTGSGDMWTFTASPAIISTSYFYVNNGKVGIGTTTPSATLEVIGQIKTSLLNESSDARFKEDIVTISDAMEKTLELRGVNYLWKEEFAKSNNLDKRKRMGLIAQEVEKIIPEVVTTGADGYKSISYSSLSGLLIEAFKEQNKVIEEQNKKIDLLFEILSKDNALNK